MPTPPFFRWLGHKVVIAEDGVAALQAVLHDRFDIVVLDLAMPRITGWEVLQSLRREPRTRNVPVLVLSGQRERESALQAGADAYCEKPCLSGHAPARGAADNRRLDQEAVVAAASPFVLSGAPLPLIPERRRSFDDSSSRILRRPAPRVRSVGRIRNYADRWPRIAIRSSEASLG